MPNRPIEGFPSPEQETESTTYIDLVRHGNRFGGKIKVKLSDGREATFDDTKDLTPEGRDLSKKFGEEYPDEVDLVHPRGGVEQRHAQTGDDIVEGSGKIGPARSNSKKELAGSPVVDKMGAGKNIKNSRRSNEGLDYAAILPKEYAGEIVSNINKEFNRLVNELPPEEQDKVLDPANSELRAKIREQAQATELKKVMKDEAIVRRAAEYEALELEHILKLSRRGVKAGETVAIPAVGSGMFAEALYKYALVVEDSKTGEKKVGFDDIDEIGGFTKQATAFRIKAVRDVRHDDPRNAAKDAARDKDLTEGIRFSYEFTDPERAKLFEGKKVYLDWDIVKELAANARKNLDSETNKNILARHADKGEWNYNLEELKSRLTADAERVMGILRDQSPESETLPITLDGVERAWKLGDEMYEELPSNCILVLGDSGQPRPHLTRVLMSERLSQLENEKGAKKINMLMVQDQEFSNLLADSAPETWPPFERLMHEQGLSFAQAAALWVNAMNKPGADVPAGQHPDESAERYREAIKQIRQRVIGEADRSTGQDTPVIFMGFGHSGSLAQIRYEHEGRDLEAEEIPYFADRYELSYKGELLNIKKVEL